MNKLGICLSGGGARGGYQIGALNALDELGILAHVKAYSGTSIGAANAAVVASNSLKEAENIWQNMPENNIPKNKKHAKAKLKIPNIDQGYYSMEIFEKIIRKAVNYDNFKDKEVFVTVSLGGEEGKGFLELLKSSYAHYIKKDPQVKYIPLHDCERRLIHPAIVASCAIPIVFSPVLINDVKCYDGGVFDRVPITPLVEAGCDTIIVIHLHKVKHFDLSRFDSSITFHELGHKGKQLGRILKFSEAQTKRLIQLGYDETMAYFKDVSFENSLL